LSKQEELSSAITLVVLYISNQNILPLTYINYCIGSFFNSPLNKFGLLVIYKCYGVGGTRGAAQRLARDFFPPPAGGNITPCI
jgi:hypothetical protein